MSATIALPAAFRGPRAEPEVSQSVLSSGLEPMGLAAQWEVSSGIAPRSAIAQTHMFLMYTLWSMVCFDRLDTSNLASAEHLSRWLLMLERATRRNARSPDFSGLESYMAHVTMSGVGAAAPLFDRHVAEEQRTAATILKQGRLEREELEHENKRKGNNHCGNQGGGGGNQNGGKQKGAAKKDE